MFRTHGGNENDVVLKRTWGRWSSSPPTCATRAPRVGGQGGFLGRNLRVPAGRARDQGSGLRSPDLGLLCEKNGFRCKKRGSRRVLPETS